MFYCGGCKARSYNPLGPDLGAPGCIACNVSTHPGSYWEEAAEKEGGRFRLVDEMGAVYTGRRFDDWAKPAEGEPYRICRPVMRENAGRDFRQYETRAEAEGDLAKITGATWHHPFKIVVGEVHNAPRTSLGTSKGFAHDDQAAAQARAQESAALYSRPPNS